jgi:hypothetical protein
MSVTLNEKNRLTAGLLRVKRSWVVGPPHGMNPLALDLVRSFIRTLTPPGSGQGAVPSTCCVRSRILLREPAG